MGLTITPKGVSPYTEKTEAQIPEIQKSPSKVYWISQLLQKPIPHLPEMILPFFKLLQETSQFCIPNTVLYTFNEVNQQLKNHAICTQTTNKEQTTHLDDWHRYRG